MDELELTGCTNCAMAGCMTGTDARPDFCTTTHLPQEFLDGLLREYVDDEENQRIFQAAAEIEGYYKGMLTRVEEICLFAQKIGAKKIGIANCLGCRNEARLFAQVLKAKGLDAVTAISCKVGGYDKTEVGIPDDAKERPGTHESMCNPIAQAKILGKLGCDLNVIVGLCVGHDSLFIKYSEAPVTYLLVKDRVLAHNPAAALYQTNSFYRRLLSPEYPPMRHEGK